MVEATSGRLGAPLTLKAEPSLSLPRVRRWIGEARADIDPRKPNSRFKTIAQHIDGQFDRPERLIQAEAGALSEMLRFLGPKRGPERARAIFVAARDNRVALRPEQWIELAQTLDGFDRGQGERAMARLAEYARSSWRPGHAVQAAVQHYRTPRPAAAAASDRFESSAPPQPPSQPTPARATANTAAPKTGFLAGIRRAVRGLFARFSPAAAPQTPARSIVSTAAHFGATKMKALQFEAFLSGYQSEQTGNATPEPSRSTEGYRLAQEALAQALERNPGDPKAMARAKFLESAALAGRVAAAWPGAGVPEKTEPLQRAREYGATDEAKAARDRLQDELNAKR